MFDYARISVMREYAKSGQWPLKIPKPLEDIYCVNDKYDRVASEGVKKSVRNLFHLIRRNKRVFPETRSQELPFYYSGNCFNSGTRAWEYPWVMSILRDRPHGVVLDVGCGSSEFLFQYLMLGHETIGLDRVRSNKYPLSELTKDFVDRWEGFLKFLDADATAIPLDNNSVDYVVCLSVLEHIVARENPRYHFKVLNEFRRVVRPGGLIIITCDTFTNPRVAYGGLPGWGAEGWNYADDIDYLDMKLFDPSKPLKTRKEIDADEDTFFIQPEMYFSCNYGNGFELFGQYHRLTSIGYVLIK